MMKHRPPIEHRVRLLQHSLQQPWCPEGPGEASKTRASHARQLRLRWLRLISFTRVRTFAERLYGASASAAKAAAAATRHQVQRGRFEDASIGLPLGV